MPSSHWSPERRRSLRATGIAAALAGLLAAMALAEPLDTRSDVPPGTRTHALIGQSDGNTGPERAPALHLFPVGSLSFGPSLAVVVDHARQLAYMGAGGVVLIIDRSDPSSPQLVDDSIRSQGLVKGLDYDASTQRLYVAGGEGGLEIWDVANPKAPVCLSVKEILYFGSETPVNNVDLRGSFAICDCSWAYVQAVDVSDPANPVQTAFHGGAGNPVTDVYVSDDGYIHSVGAQGYQRIFLDQSGVLFDAGFKLFDFGAFPVAGNDSVAYVGHGTLWILDLLAGGFPPWSVTDVGGFEDIEVEGAYAYLMQDNGLGVWDVSVPTTPVHVGQYTTNWVEKHLALDPGPEHVYVATSSEGMQIVDVSDPSTPSLTGTHPAYGVTWNTALVGDLAYLSHSYDGFYVVDVSDPAFPVRVSTTDTPGETRDLAIQGDMAYVADWTGGLRIYDVSVPSTPSLVAVDDTFDAWRVLVDGETAYVLEVVPNVSTTLHVFDVGTPSAPVDMGQVTFATSLPWDLALRGDVLYVAGQDAGVIITDVSNPTAPAQVGSIPLMDVTDVLIANDVLYVTVANTSGGLYTYDLTDPTSPAQLGSYHVTGFFPRHVAVANGFGYCLDTFDVQLFDVSDPSNLIHLDEYRTPGDIVEVSARGDLVFVSDGQAGLRILRNDIVVTGVDESSSPARVTLSANRPNPFTPQTTIGFTVPSAGPVRLTMHTADGRRVATLLDRSVTSGEHRVRWDGRDTGGRELPAGVYFYRLETKDGMRSGRATLVR